ncbi:hypothetical protein [Bacillus massiliigorillae]|uniref:hypothetical protein n=1 Tax=Bacillus massiliigorillae TaxID=1243664 RepID=UPI0003A4D91F|nr:hypothetical protein [Bacillus massiliigorillae]
MTISLVGGIATTSSLPASGNATLSVSEAHKVCSLGNFSGLSLGNGIGSNPMG